MTDNKSCRIPQCNVQHIMGVETFFTEQIHYDKEGTCDVQYFLIVHNKIDTDESFQESLLVVHHSKGRRSEPFVNNKITSSHGYHTL